MCLSQPPIVQAPNGRASGSGMLLSAHNAEKNLIIKKEYTFESTQR
jgi:hypothetical protein